MKKKSLKKNSILITSFTETKFSFYAYIKDIKKKYSQKSKIYLANSKKTIFHEYFNNFIRFPKSINFNRAKILQKLKKYKIGLVIPTSDQELEFWSKNKAFYNQNQISIPIMDYDDIKIFTDKLNFYNFCTQNKINTPKVLLKLEDLKNEKYVIKERFSNRKNKVLTNLSKINIKKSLNFFINPLIQKQLIGQEFSIDAWRNKNEKKFDLIVRKRSFVKNGDSKITEIINDKKILNIIRKELKKFNFYYHCVFQGIFFKGKFYFIECNPRFGGASVSSMMYSLKSVHSLISDLYGIKLAKKNFNKKFKRQYKFETTYYK